MIDKIKHIKYLIFSYFVTFSNIVTGLVLFPMIIKFQGLEELGVFGLLFSTKAIVDIGLGWLSSSMTRSLLKTRFNFNNIATVSFFVNSAYGVISAGLVFLYGWIYKVDYLTTYSVFAVYITVSFITIPCFEVLNAKLLQFKVAYFRFVQQFIFMILAIVGYYYFRNITTIFLSLLLASVTVFIYSFIYIKFKGLFSFSITKHYKKILNRVFLSQGALYFVNGILTIMLLQIDVFIIEYFFGTEDVGKFILLWRIPNTIIMLGWRVSEPLQHDFGRNYKKKNNNDLRKTFYYYERIVLLVATIGSISYLFLGEFVLTLWLGAGEYPSYDYMFTVSSLVIFFAIIQRFYSNVCYYTKGLERVSFLLLVEIIFKIVFVSLLYDDLSVMSSIYGWAIAFLFTLPFYRVNAKKLFNEK
ncbi:lipopolysaccharide biosynthesis protein [Vibrio sp. 10N.286.48.B7]|uniref:lipopolysaccharide biosynthesis protein n=1 Tax=Vibrio sp. 10N.286.48.B7 TaxID=1880853 RepID=UPI0039A520E5